MPYPLALALTLLVEVPLYTAALGSLGRVRPARAALTGAAVNGLTHPVLWWSLRHAAAGPAAAYWTAFALAEVSVCVVEAVLAGLLTADRAAPAAGPGGRSGSARPLPWPLLGGAALTANASSVLVGLLAAR
ncbi:hypothetical protein [Kitasatospora sp. DSM 101779]|uniref:hypothetical protein n=1 Tax=Kitasatospora sp. DSM 101779 TaxID=2853165 RepID=UPI0021D7E39C|nr:hypothetical protein [Kitasatospora sp. DSM 101779]MCU7824773.1 hypothetical protein [Kitasatospora sp. DSM 101779]